MFFTASQSFPNLKTPVITFVNAHTISHYLLDISAVMKQNFIYRMLFRDIYPNVISPPFSTPLHMFIV